MIHLPDGLPALQALRAEGTVCASYLLQQAAVAGVPGDGSLRVLFLNLMPEKEQAELDVCRVLAASKLDVQLIPVRFRGQTYKTTPQAHMESFYLEVEAVQGAFFDGLIINGAPLEHLPYAEVRYWDAFCRLMDWAGNHVRSTFHVCWGAQAGLYYHYGIPKFPLREKRFGVYVHRVLCPDSPLLRGLPADFPVPVSRHTEVRAIDFQNTPVRIVATDARGGVGLAVDEAARRVFSIGHLEYEPLRLAREYQRDVALGRPIALPGNYYEGDNPAAPVRHVWRTAAELVYGNWLRYYVAPGNFFQDPAVTKN
ncbi:MAG: homoserine O-succinyltransferase [Alloprevotella sp.]|nr:homoserine O-succinyltransferase [Alloprevotella sp.]